MNRGGVDDVTEQQCSSRNLPIRKRTSHHCVASQSNSSVSSSSSLYGNQSATNQKTHMPQYTEMHSNLLEVKVNEYTIKCKYANDNDEHELKRHKPIGSSRTIVLSWGPPFNIPSMEAEEALLPLLLRYGVKERGMMFRQHYSRIKTIKNACKQYKINLDQALSMRRTHMKLLNPNVQDISRLGLGKLGDVRQSAELFEQAVATYLKQNRIRFYTESDQRAMAQEKGQAPPPTPDFLLKDSITLDSSSSQPINWIEAKMFYAASTIPDGSNNAVGCLLQTARRYVQTYGPGAFVFSFGYGMRMKSVLEAEGVIVLDSRPLNLRRMREHQRSWCANDRGQILP
mmetsp:Transcript_2199/g.4040  ORF Transcript_2199/g.4040 Transcript_2199/m.4040 type:complete len:342 (-) Transcript_2199:115-1140(-)